MGFGGYFPKQTKLRFKGPISQFDQKAREGVLTFRYWFVFLLPFQRAAASLNHNHHLPDLCSGTPKPNHHNHNNAMTEMLPLIEIPSEHNGDLHNAATTPVQVDV